MGTEYQHEKTEYLVVGDKGDDLDVGSVKVKNTKRFRYLGVLFTDDGKSTTDINNKIGQGKQVISQINSVLWNNKVKKKTKTTIYKTIIESICTYGSETWELTKRNKDRLLALEMDFWRRSCGVSKLQHVRNVDIREQMNVQGTILDTIETKKLRWYGHLERMPENRWPKKIWQWVPHERKKRGRPPRSWKEDIAEAMSARDLQTGDWADRKAWRIGNEKWRQL